MAQIVLQEIVKQYGSLTVIDHLNLTMEDNEFTVLVGPSGCGKSTTLRMVAGLEDVTEGEIFIDGKAVTHLDPKDRDVAMVFQDYALYPHMNVARNMSFALRLAHYPKAEIDKRVREVAGTLGIEDLLHRKPRELSGGQRQRVAMGRALVRDASTFLFDEPLSNLDAKLRTQMRAELALMRQRLNKNMIYVTHDQVEAMTLGDRIVVMHEGYIQQQGSPEELFKRPANKFVAGFIGSPAMNFLDGQVSEEGGHPMVKGAGFSFRLPETRREALAGRGNPKVTVGIRPSVFVPAEEGADAVNLIRLPALVSEYIGAHSVLIADCGGTQVTVEIDSETPIAVGQELSFTIDPGTIHLFDTESEESI